MCLVVKVWGTQMIQTLPDDDVESICTHLDALSGLYLASTAKPILGQARRLQVLARADAAAGRIQRAFRRFYWWPSALRAMTSTLEPAVMALAAQRAKAAILNRFEGLVQSENVYHVQAAAKKMETLVTILHEVCEETLQPGKLPGAAACVEELVEVLRELCDPWSDNELGELVCWDRQELHSNDDFFAYTFPAGDDLTSLKCYFVQMQIWTGYCYRGHEMMDVIVKNGGLNACALAFAALHRWDCVDTVWHGLAESMFQHSGNLEEETIEETVYYDDEECLLHADPDEMLARLSDPTRVDCPRVRGMFRAMRDERNAALAVLSEPRANELAMGAARAFIETEQS